MTEASSLARTSNLPTIMESVCDLEKACMRGQEEATKQSESSSCWPSHVMHSLKTGPWSCRSQFRLSRAMDEKRQLWHKKLCPLYQEMSEFGQQAYRSLNSRFGNALLLGEMEERHNQYRGIWNQISSFINPRSTSFTPRSTPQMESARKTLEEVRRDTEFLVFRTLKARVQGTNVPVCPSKAQEYWDIGRDSKSTRRDQEQSLC